SVDAARSRAQQAKSLLSKALALIGAPSFELIGEGNDVITGGNAIDLIFTGDGVNQVSTGGGPADMVIGGKDEDHVDGSQTYLNIQIGGAGNDRLIGSMFPGAFANVLIGDSFQFHGTEPTPNIAIDFQNLNFSKISVAAGLLSEGNGTDSLTAASGFNVFFGGDGNDDLTGGDLLNALFGDSLNLGVSFELQLQQIWDTDLSTDQLLSAITDALRLPGLSGSGDDVIHGGSGIDIAMGGSGNDTLTGNAGIDFLFGNSGKDVLRGNAGFNILVGGDSDDEINGGDDGNFIIGDTFDIASDVGARIGVNLEALKNGRFVSGVGIVAGGNGADTLVGGDGFDFIIGGDGNDSLSGGGGLNIAFGDAFSVGTAESIDLRNLLSNPIAILFSPSNFVERLSSTFQLVGTGNDVYSGGPSTDVVWGGAGNDRLSGNAGFDFLVGGAGDDVVDGGPGLTQEIGGVLLGGPGDDDIRGGDSNDHLQSEAGNDTFHGGAGNDRIFGGSDNDQLYGEAGDDHLYGEDGDDVLIGGTGNDVLYGGPDEDQLDGGPDKNYLFQDPVVLVLGDSNHDGEFNSSDLVQVFQAGKYEDATAGNAAWEDGDWNGDGDFNTSDLVHVFQAATYVFEALSEPTSSGPGQRLVSGLDPSWTAMVISNDPKRRSTKRPDELQSTVLFPFVP
ncbi:MAG: hypothetical protein KDA87_25220, partial [Planctomycetales bacterium]|nr:hypothetical protein [Planctomycetales bacterium]